MLLLLFTPSLWARRTTFTGTVTQTGAFSGSVTQTSAFTGTVTQG